jgi:hypothetical protein
VNTGASGRSGTAGSFVAGGAGNVSCAFSWDFEGSAPTPPVYLNIWLRFSALSNSANAKIVILNDGVHTGSNVGIMWNTNNKISLIVGDTVRATTTNAVATQAWILYRIRADSKTVGNFTSLKVNGEVLSDTHKVTQVPTRLNVGWYTAQSGGAGVNHEFEADDIIINDASGSFETGEPDSTSHLYVLPPVSDINIAAWRGGAGGATNLWDAVNNFKVTHNDGSTTETDITQNVNADEETAPSDYDVAIQKIKDFQGNNSSDSIFDTQTIRFACAIVRHAVATNDNINGSVTLELNPNDGSPVSFIFGNGTAHSEDWYNGTTTTNTWLTTFGTYMYFPTINRNNNTHIVISRLQTGATIAEIDGVGMLVEAASSGGQPVTVKVKQDND